MDTCVYKLSCVWFPLLGGVSHTTFYFYLLIYFCLWWISIATWGLSLGARSEGCSLLVVCGLLIALASLVTEHRLQVHGFQYLWHVGSVVVTCGLQSTSSVVVAHGLSFSMTCGTLPNWGSDPMSLALSGRFLSTAPPRKSYFLLLKRVK